MQRESGTPFGTLLRQLRHEQGVTQLDLALALGASDPRYISRLETGRRDNPSTAFVTRVVKAFVELGHPLTAGQVSRLADAALGEPARATAAEPLGLMAPRDSHVAGAVEAGGPDGPRELVIRLVIDVDRRVRVADRDDAA